MLMAGGVTGRIWSVMMGVVSQLLVCLMRFSLQQYFMGSYRGKNAQVLCHVHLWCDKHDLFYTDIANIHGRDWHYLKIVLSQRLENRRLFPLWHHRWFCLLLCHYIIMVTYCVDRFERAGFCGIYCTAQFDKYMTSVERGNIICVIILQTVKGPDLGPYMSFMVNKVLFVYVSTNWVVTIEVFYPSFLPIFCFSWTSGRCGLCSFETQQEVQASPWSLVPDWTVRPCTGPQTKLKSILYAKTLKNNKFQHS